MGVRLQTRTRTAATRAPSFTLAQGGLLQRKCACGGCAKCREEELTVQRTAADRARPSAVPPIVRQVLRSTGQPLDQATRAFMEPRFGHDFSRVRVHTDAKAAESARMVNALAYTVGRHVVFGTGQYSARTTAGQRLLAHELTHAAQQGLQPYTPEQAITMGENDRPEEREADRLSVEIAARNPAPQISPSALKLARQEDESRPGVVETQETPPGSPPGADRDEGGAEGAGERAPGPAQATSAPVCAPTALSRRDFLAQAGTGLSEFGLTTLEVDQVTFPSLQLTPVGRRVRVQPTTASLPNIRSIFIGAGTFTEGTTRVVGAGGQCPEGVYPLRWTITPEGARKIQAGEQEHCDDFNFAFDLSAGRYRDAINQIAASGRTFRNEAAVRRHLQSVVGFSFDDLPSVFTCLADKTRVRDSRRGDWHTPRPRRSPPDRFNHCEFARAFIDRNSLPQVGQHSSGEIIQGCGETPARRGTEGQRRSVERRQRSEGETE